MAHDEHSISVPGPHRQRGEGWTPRLWLALGSVVLVALCLESYGLATWPMADDEVPSLVELGLSHIDAESFFSVPPDQIPKLPKATIVWNLFQRAAIGLLPAGEPSFRIPSLICGVLTSALVFVLAARWRGLWFAYALAIIQHSSQAFIYLVQLDRFYSMPLLLLVLTLAAICWPRGGAAMMLAVAVLAALTVLSHNITLALFVLALLAAVPAYVLGAVPLRLVLRSAAAAAVSVLVYFSYLRPLVRGWSSTGNPTPVLISFAAHTSVPVLALAAFGGVLAFALFRHREREPVLIWWILILLGSLCAFQLTNISWNPRYFLFFMPAVWILAAFAMEFVARRTSSVTTGVAWYGCIAIILMPSLLSHFQDGSRHDYRQAAAVVVKYYHSQEPILSDDAETISYYLPPQMHHMLQVRTKAKQYPRSEFFLVCRANAWTPLPEIPNRQMDLLAEIYKRRYDQFSHILRVYRVAAEEPRTKVTF
jgi:hypothetical protein